MNSEGKKTETEIHRLEWRERLFMKENRRNARLSSRPRTPADNHAWRAPKRGGKLVSNTQLRAACAPLPEWVLTLLRS